MNNTLTIPKNAKISESRSRPPSIAVRAQDANSFFSPSSIDLNQYLKDGATKNKWLNKLEEKPLLELMAESLPQKQLTPVNATELNCYERLKKLLSAQNGLSYD